MTKKKKVKKKVKKIDHIKNNSKFIHAYGPKKKVIIMPINYTIKLIYKTANLLVKKISNIKNY